MGKVRRRRSKSSTPSNDKCGPQPPYTSTDNSNIDKKLSDTASIKSFKSEMGGQITKKTKLKFRRSMLLNKMDNKGVDKNSTKFVPNTGKVGKVLRKKGTEKASVRQKKFLQGVKLFKRIMENRQFKKNPKKMISKHMASVVTIIKP
ncbi:uncharacterized protein LOC116180257 [Photinus pyralis]|uniref:Uncharacterized protein n=1 Tax=Photinus pyralis TaxID=7054 RepID=A0A1Y1N6W4_PHOPY|nr:uncharacterized protein LOC116180257 [Photinus pyralis]